MTPTLKRLTLALAISVGLNLFFAGFLVARVVMGPRRMHPMMGPPPMLGPMGMWEDVPDPHVRRRMKQLMDARRERLEHDREALRHARRKVADEIQREPPDRVQLDRAFDELRQATTASQAQLHEGLIELAITLTPEQRKQLMDAWMARAHPRGHRRSGPEAELP